MTSPDVDLATLLPGYALERELGRGAMGVVYLARHEALGRLVAVKELQGALASDPATRSRFIIEAKVMASLDHPHVVPVYDFVERDDRCALVMERLDGGTVWDRFVSDGLAMPQAAAITLATCSAMQHAHDKGVLHRDIKPENLMFDGAGSMKVTDFGIARVVNGPSTKATLAGSVLGTPAYMAPEQAEGKSVDAAVDVYATATMFYEMLSGRLPFERTDSLTGMLTQRVLHDPLPLSSTAPHVPAELASATMRGLARDPASRTSTAEQFGHELAAAAAAAWGPSWLDASGIIVSGSDTIERAARTTGATARPSAVAADARSTMLPGDAVAPASSRASETMLPGDIDAPSPATSPATGPAAEPGPAPTSEEAVETPPADRVRPHASDRDIGRAKADEIDRLIDISEILEAPARPTAHYLIAVVLFLLAAAWAWFGNSAGTTAIMVAPGAAEARYTINGKGLDVQPIDIDLTQPIVLSGATPGEIVSVSVTQLGAPVGSTTPVVASATGSAILDPGFLGRVTTGAADAEIVVSSQESGPTVQPVEFALTGTNPWYLTAAGVISMILVLFGIAGIESYLRAFRTGRGRITTYLGLLAVGAILGGAAAVACTIVFGTSRGLPGLVGPAALGAAGALALGLATRANRNRRRAARQQLRHTAIRALAKR